MTLDDQPEAVGHLFRQIDRANYSIEPSRKTNRIRLLFRGIPLGGWADDTNGPHWYVFENANVRRLHPGHRQILEHFGFSRVPHGKSRHYWRVRDAERMWCFKRAVEEITCIPLLKVDRR